MAVAFRTGRRSARAAALFGCAMAAAAPAAAQGWVGLGSGAPGWAYYAPGPYFAYPSQADYYRFNSYYRYPDGFFIGGSFGGHYQHRWR